jgi:transposase
MSQEKYIGMDVHQATISVAVMDAGGKLIMECLLETKGSTIVEFIQGLHGTLSLTFEEGTSAAWLHDLLKPHVSQLVVCDPRKAALLKEGDKNDRIDARKLAEALPAELLSSQVPQVSVVSARAFTRWAKQTKGLFGLTFSSSCGG